MIKFRRLQVMETFLRTRAVKLKGKFDLEQWVPKDQELIDHIFNGRNHTDFQANPKTMDCGFAGCVMGWAAVLPSFRRLGLRLEKDNEYDLVVYPLYNGRTDWGAVHELFGLDSQDAQYLFSSSEYNPDEWTDPLAVAKRIREFIADNVPDDSPCKYIAKHLQESN